MENKLAIIQAQETIDELNSIKSALTPLIEEFKNLKDKLDLDEKVFTSIDEVESENIKFNVILLSSVLNDVFAQYNINTKDKINNMFFAKFSELLEDNGSLVIVDYAFPDELGELILDRKSVV